MGNSVAKPEIEILYREMRDEISEIVALRGGSLQSRQVDAMIYETACRLVDIWTVLVEFDERLSKLDGGVS